MVRASFCGRRSSGLIEGHRRAPVSGIFLRHPSVPVCCCRYVIDMAPFDDSSIDVVAQARIAIVNELKSTTTPAPESPGYWFETSSMVPEEEQGTVSRIGADRFKGPVFERFPATTRAVTFWLAAHSRSCRAKPDVGTSGRFSVLVFALSA